MSDENILSNCTGFDWDKHNSEKIWTNHRVSPSESEQIFFNLPLVITDAVKYAGDENRLYALGRTNTNRLLFVVFTIRGKNIRIISARNMSRKERKVYLAYEKENS